MVVLSSWCLRPAVWALSLSSVLLFAGCGLVLEADPPSAGADGSVAGGCTRNGDCVGCTMCVDGACVPAEGEPCVASGRCLAGTYVCDTGSARCDVSARTPAPAGATCRPARSECDVAETCDGVTDSCADDAFVAPGMACEGGVCDGTGECRRDECVSGAPCDTGNPCELGAIVCGATGRTCVPTEAAPSGTVCRPARDVCDQEEHCEGTTCPSDGLLGSDVTCRGAAFECDAVETCDGSNEGCPPDALAPLGSSCSAGFCDSSGTCTDTCAPGDSCDPGNPCEEGVVMCESGTPACAGTGVARSAGTLCRPPAGVCDAPDTCDGVGTSCPHDDREPTTTVCRPSAGPCDLADTCDGSNVGCPSDATLSATTICRASTGLCDVAERCTGGTTCPADGLRPGGVVCRTAPALCLGDATCNGTSATCPTNPPLGPGMTCTSSPGITGMCDGSGMCVIATACMTGAGCDSGCGRGTVTCASGMAVCMPTMVYPAGTVCRPAADATCGRPEVCDGVSYYCPPDLHRADGMPCSPCTAWECAAGTCAPTTAVPVRGTCWPGELCCNWGCDTVACF